MRAEVEHQYTHAVSRVKGLDRSKRGVLARMMRDELSWRLGAAARAPIEVRTLAQVDKAASEY